MSGDPPRGPWSDAHGFLQFNPQGEELARYPTGYVEGLQAEIERLRADNDILSTGKADLRAILDARDDENDRLRAALQELYGILSFSSRRKWTAFEAAMERARTELESKPLSGEMMDQDAVRIELIEAQRAEIEMLRNKVEMTAKLWKTMAEEKGAEVDQLRQLIALLNNDNEHLLEALRKIVAEADSDDGLTAWDGGNIARAALEKRLEK